MSNVRKKLGISNGQISEAAKKALRSSGFETKRNNCLRFVRQVVGSVRPKAWPLPIGPNAWEAYQLLRDKGYEIPLSHGSQIGDLLFKAPTEAVPQGHVGIRIEGNRVAENSSFHANSDDDDARGTRSLKEFGRVAAIIRLGDDFNAKYPRQ
jgi:hypothetical protein